ncbi:hypothetical protein HMPREF0578_2345 [Mobiluncus mulieris 28-1]|nr:hypothetical protein HMPREF0578_2345 [Mobiluncus mulieris 28-1]
MISTLSSPSVFTYRWERNTPEQIFTIIALSHLPGCGLLAFTLPVLYF